MKMIPMFEYDDKVKKAAKNEIWLLRSLESPFILKYHNHFLKGGVMHICMEYAEGGTVEEKIKQFKDNSVHIPEDYIINWIA